MADQQDFEVVSAELTALHKNDVRYPDMPVEQAVKEASIMAAAAEQDTEKLKAVGLDVAKVQALAAAVGALSHAQSRYVAAMGEVKEAAGQWAAEEPAALQLRADILAAATYALRNVPDAVRAVKHIRQGASGVDMHQDLGDLALLGKKYEKQLAGVSFDVKLLDVAEQKARLLRDLYTKAVLEKGTAGAKDTRDRAFTYMRACMSQVLDAAEYALRKDPTRLSYYYSSYRAARPSRQADAAAPSATPAEAVVAS